MGKETYLGVVLSPGEEGQLIGRGEVGPDLLHLPKALPLSPLGPPVLEPNLQTKQWWSQGLGIALRQGTLLLQ